MSRRPWERRRYWLPEGWTAPSAYGLRVRAALLDSTRPPRHRGDRDLAHEEGIRVLAEDKRAKRRARNLALELIAAAFVASPDHLYMDDEESGLLLLALEAACERLGIDRVDTVERVVARIGRGTRVVLR